MQNESKKKYLWGLLTFFVIAGIFALTFQTTTQTIMLTHWTMKYLEDLGFHPEIHTLRSNVHVPMYFVLGLVLSLYGKAKKWRFYLPGILGCAIGTIDEIMKIILPTREFDWIDLSKDYAGILLAVLLTNLIIIMNKKIKAIWKK